MAPKQNMLFLSGLSVMAILAADYYLRVPEDEVARPTARVASIRPEARSTARTDGLQWMGALPAPALDKQEDVRPLGEVVATLTASRQPADALKAYQIIEGCESLRPVFELDPMPPAFLRQKTQCASIGDVMRRSRYDYLRTAAVAGVPGVGSDWLRYGPSGDMAALRTKPDDPSVVEWKRQAVALVIRDGDQGDFNALQDLVNGYAGKTPLFEADPGRELAYAMAYKEVVNLLHLEPMLKESTEAELEALAAKLSPEQVAWAKAKAGAIVAARGKRSASASR